MHTAELLSPAGDFTCLIAALDAGADAVYFGVQSFNMRSKAKNFSIEELPEIVEKCHQFGSRAYLTLNSIVYEDELASLRQLIDRAAAAEVDAVIGWDAAVIEIAREYGLNVHMSTQASVSNSRAVLAYYRKYGIRRFVLAREVSLEQLGKIRHNLRHILGDEADVIEFECFIHGAMCVSLSGRCFLSESQNGNSANRGGCLQPCRRKYRITDIEGEYEFDIGNDYILSPNDLCTMPFIEKILKASPSCLKIEGRMRNPEYVATVTRAYRRAIDSWNQVNSQSSATAMRNFENLKTELVEELRTVFNRGFHAGYYMGRPMNEWTRASDNQSLYRKETVGRVENYYRKSEVAEILVQGAAISSGDELLIQGRTSGNVLVSVNELRVNDKPVEKSVKGDVVTVKVTRNLRRGDSVFRRYMIDDS